MSSDSKKKNAEAGARFREERERLGFSQANLGTELDASTRTLNNWESGGSSPTAEALSRFHALGADVLYIITGQRSPLVSADDGGRAASIAGRLAADLAVMDLDEEGADLLLRMAKKLSY